MSEIDWKFCIICQKASVEELRCLSHNPTPAYNAMDAYNAFVRYFQEIKGLNLLPVRMELEENGLGLMNHQAKWHKHCHQKFNNSKLENVKAKRQREDTADNSDQEKCRPKRRPSEINKNLCIFCDLDGSEPLHDSLHSDPI